MLFVQAILHSFLEHRNVGKSKVFDCVADIYIKNISIGV